MFGEFVSFSVFILLFTIFVMFRFADGLSRLD